MSDRLTLTVEEIARFTAQATPPALSIGPADIPQTALRARLQITSEDVAAFAPAGAAAVSELEQAMFRLVNAARREHLPDWMPRPLRWHPGVAAVARGHAADMLERQYVAHTAPDGSDVTRRLDRAGISFLACGENIGVVYGPASHGPRGIEEVQKAFMNQPRRLTNHRGNILNPAWTHVGIGVAYAPEGRLIVTQNFIATLTAPAG